MLALRRVPARGDVRVRSGHDDQSGGTVHDAPPVLVGAGKVDDDLVALPEDRQQARVGDAVGPDGDELADVYVADQAPDLLQVLDGEVTWDVHDDLRGWPRGRCTRPAGRGARHPEGGWRDRERR